LKLSVAVQQLTVFDPPCMSAVVREQDDKLRLIRLDRSRSDGGKTAVLELKNLTSLELVRLPFSYTGAFAESAPSDRRLYTLGHTQQRRERSIVMTCLSICLFVCLSHLRKYASDLYQFLCRLPIFATRSSSGGVAISCVLPVL